MSWTNFDRAVLLRRSPRQSAAWWRPPPADILMDVSRSMNADRAKHVVRQLAAAGFRFGRWFRWANGFEEVRDQTAATSAFAGPATELAQAIRGYQAAATSGRAVVVTDADGAGKFAILREAGVICDERYLCVNIETDLDVERAIDWAFGEPSANRSAPVGPPGGV